MSYEVEIKASIKESQIEAVRNAIASMAGAEFEGEIRKSDVYYAYRKEDHQLFRVREQKIGDKSDILLTAKPEKKYLGSEINREIEFSANASDIGNIHAFFKSLGYVVCLKKTKDGFGYTVPFNGFDIHAEIMSVSTIGTFLELEITSIENAEDEVLVNKAQFALYSFLKEAGVSEKAIEKRSYRSMILEAEKTVADC